VKPLRSLPNAAETADLARSLGVFVERPDRSLSPVADALGLALPDREEHTALFVLALPPYGSIYLGPEGRIGGRARGVIAGFWRAVGADPGPEPDHLTALLGLYGSLIDRAEATEPEARRVLAVEAVRALFWEHLVSWLPAYLVAVRAHGGVYARWADLCGRFLVDEARRLGPPAATPIHFRDPGAGPDPRSEEDFLEPLLAPVRSGIVLTRADLATLAQALDLGLRMGERRYALEEMLAHDPRGVLAGLADLAATWVRRLEELDHVLAPVVEHWARRAAATASTLRPD